MADFATRRRIMVDTQVRTNDVTSYPIIEAMLAIPREYFVPDRMRQAAYLGEDVPLGGDRYLMAPRTFAKLLEALGIAPNDLILVIGSGQGYGAAVLSRIAEAVVAVEEDESLVAEAQSALADAEADSVVLEAGPLAEGAAQYGPYDAILIEGGVERIPDGILDQLKEGGRIATVFEEFRLGIGRLGLKDDGRVSWRDVFNGSAPVLPGFEARRAFAL